MDFIKIWKNRRQIAEGIKNNIFKQEHIESLAEQRMQICIKCSKFDITGKDCEVPGTQPCCGICGCSLALKTRALSSSCPDNKPKWNAVVTEEQEDQINYQIFNADQDGDQIQSGNT
tara:strand:- start:462 stop:812 length:351 start_codon:yes stop_codon:yes gene_type:complete